MKSTLQDLEQILRSGKPVAYTALVETKGSTPQKPGATMLVFPDGSQSGTLGGGCVEADVKRHALRVLDEGEAGILTFTLDGDYGWDDGLICGGRMRMLVDPIRPHSDTSFYQALCAQTALGRGVTEAIVIDPEKAGGGQSADRWLMDEAGTIVANAGSGELPASLVENVKPLASRPAPYLAEGIAYLTHLERVRLLIVGGGHVGQKVAEMATDADFDVWVIDDREQYCNPERFPDAKRLIVGDFATALSGLEIDANTFCIIVTRGHNHDEEALYHLAETPARYVGMIGSRRKIKLIFEDLLREGISRDAIERVHAPLGIEIGSQTVPEIAISIVAELIAFRNLGEIPPSLRRETILEKVAAASTSEKAAQ